MRRFVVYLSARSFTGSIFRFFGLWRAIERWGGEWEIMVRTPLNPPRELPPYVSWHRIPLPEPSLSLEGDRMEEWIKAWIAGWDLWLEGEREVVEEFSPGVILTDLAPQPLLLARDTGIPGWFLGHFNWFSYLAQFMEVSGLLDEVALAYESAQLAFVPPLSWGQGIFPVLQEIPLVGGFLDVERVREARKAALARGMSVFVDRELGGLCGELRELWGRVAFLEDLEELPAAHLACLRPSYSSLVMALRGEVPCLLFHGGVEPGASMAAETEGLGVALARGGEPLLPPPWEIARLINEGYEAYRALPSLYRLEGSQFLVETLIQV